MGFLLMKHGKNILKQLMANVRLQHSSAYRYLIRRTVTA
nr:MAG TPA: hypothetical protein [Caudoviricetes sp.]